MSRPALRFSRVMTAMPEDVGPGCRIAQFRHDAMAPGAMSPFVMVDHFHMWKPTFDVHPHAGFSAVTLMFEDTRGEMQSRDSLGHVASFGAGDLHWTLAGRGILHTQVPVGPQAHIHALQIFVNLPSALKNAAPDSFRVRAVDMPVFEGDGIRVRVVAGTFGGLRSPAVTPIPVRMLDGQLHGSRKALILPVEAEWNAWIHLVSGSLRIRGVGELKAGQAVCAGAGPRRGRLLLEANEEAHFVVLAGPRIDEPVVARGPFVFESEASMERAISDFRAGRFGSVPDPVTPRVSP